MATSSIGTRLRALRRERTLTQHDLATLAHVGARTVQRLEHDATNPGVETLTRIAHVLKVSLDEISPKSSDDVLIPAEIRRRGISSRLLSVSQVAALLKISPRTVYRRRHTARWRLPRYIEDAQGRLRFDPQVVSRFLNGDRRAAASLPPVDES